jgi:hypothetical protein
LEMPKLGVQQNKKKEVNQSIVQETGN